MKIDSGLEQLATKVLFETDEERQLFSSRTFKTRLCFEESLDVGGQLSITKADGYDYDPHIRLITFPWDASNLKRDSYYFRFSFDMNNIEKGNLPLHCGAMKIGNTGLFILGESKSGKSLILSNLSLINLGEIVGDDHVIVRNLSMSGNEIIGFRQKGSEIKSYTHSKRGLFSFEDYIIVSIDVRKRKKIRAGKQILEEGHLKEETLKYFLSKPLESRFAKAIDRAEVRDLQEKYIGSFERFVGDAREIYQVNGKLDYVINNLAEVLKDDNK